MKVKEGKESQRNSVWLPGNERCWGSLPNYKRSVCPPGRTAWALHCPLQPGQCSRSVSTWCLCYPFINVAVGMSEGICTLPAKKKWAMCGTLGKGNAGMRPNQKVFLTAVIHSEELFLLLDACFADTVLTGVIKLHLPESEKCAVVLQVIGCKSVDCDGLCITVLGQLWKGLVMAFSSVMTSWLSGKETLNSGKKHITLHHIWTWTSWTVLMSPDNSKRWYCSPFGTQLMDLNKWNKNKQMLLKIKRGFRAFKSCTEHCQLPTASHLEFSVHS